MPLLDPFHPPLSTLRHWESFHTTWAAAIADALNEQWLPEGYFTEEQVHPAGRVEIDELRLGTRVLEALLRAQEAELPRLAFPSRAWERGSIGAV